jgi:hypothetical protein
MRLDLDTEIRYQSGERAGVLRRVILDANNDVSQVVMATDGLISRNVLVPISLLAEDAGGVMTIVASPDEIDALEDYTEERVPAAPDEWEINDDYVPGSDVFPGTLLEPLIPVAMESNVTEGAISLRQGTIVNCLDGPWGQVDEVLVDETGRAYGFIARPDASDEFDRVVPIELVQQADGENVLLNCTIADLPTYTQETIDEHEEPELH